MENIPIISEGRLRISATISGLTILYLEPDKLTGTTKIKELVIPYQEIEEARTVALKKESEGEE
jgi:hypothetical protein